MQVSGFVRRLDQLPHCSVDRAESSVMWGPVGKMVRYGLLRCGTRGSGTGTVVQGLTQDHSYRFSVLFIFGFCQQQLAVRVTIWGPHINIKDKATNKTWQQTYMGPAHKRQTNKHTSSKATNKTRQQRKHLSQNCTGSSNGKKNTIVHADSALQSAETEQQNELNTATDQTAQVWSYIHSYGTYDIYAMCPSKNHLRLNDVSVYAALDLDEKVGDRRELVSHCLI